MFGVSRARLSVMPTSGGPGVIMLNFVPKLARQSLRTQVRGGKSGLH